MPYIIYEEDTLNAQIRRAKKTDLRSKKTRCKYGKENNEEFTKIDPEFLNKLMTTPVLSASIHSILEIFSIYCRKGKNYILSKIFKTGEICKKEAKGIQKQPRSFKSKKKYIRQAFKSEPAYTKRKKKKESTK